jgi:hypothetical protein
MTKASSDLRQSIVKYYMYNDMDVRLHETHGDESVDRANFCKVATWNTERW